MKRVLTLAALPVLAFHFRPHLLRALQLNRQLGTLLAAALCKHLQLSLQSLHALAQELLVLLKPHAGIFAYSMVPRLQSAVLKIGGLLEWR